MNFISVFHFKTLFKTDRADALVVPSESPTGEVGGVPVKPGEAAPEGLALQGGRSPTDSAMKKQRRSRAYLIYIAQVTP